MSIVSESKIYHASYICQTAFIHSDAYMCSVGYNPVIVEL